MKIACVLLVSMAMAAAQVPQVPIQVGTHSPLGLVIPTPYELDSGPQTHPGGTETVAVWSDGVHLPWAKTMVLHFSVADLGTDDDWIEVHSLEDGQTQILNRARLKQWRHETARFNGGTVALTLHLAPGSTGRVEVDLVHAGALPAPSDTACGNADDRVLSSDDRVCRLVINNGGICTGFLISSTSTILTAGHCGWAGTITSYRAEFNVPASTSGGSIVAPPVADQFPVDVDSAQFEDTGGVGSDWAVARLHPNSSGETAFARQGAFFDLASSVPFGFIPWNGPTVRVTGNGTDGGTRNFVQQTDTGNLDNVFGDSVFHHVDTEGGNSGGPVILNSTGEVIAIHTDGGCDSNSFSSNGATSILRSNLQSAISEVVGCASITLADNTPVSVTCSDTIFAITPDDTKWNVVGVSSTSDWDIEMDGSSSLALNDTCDFLLANGHLGSLPPRSGSLHRFSGSSSARAHFHSAVTMSVGTPLATTWNSTAIVRIYEFNVTSAGSYEIGVFGEPSLSWRLYSPGTSSAWRSRGSSTLITSGAVGGNIAGNVILGTGFHAIVVSRDGNAATPVPPELTISVCPATAALSLTANSESSITASCQEFLVTPSSGQWNAVAIGAPTSTTYDVYLGTGQSSTNGIITNFVLADGAQGTIPATRGVFFRSAGTAAGTGVHRTSTSLNLGGQLDTSLSTGEILDLFSFNVTTAGNFTINISGGGGAANLLWRVYEPRANAEWFARNESATTGAVGGSTSTIALGTGVHALAVYSNTGPLSTAQSYGVNVCPAAPVINLASGGSANVTLSCVPFDFTPQSGSWNAIALGSAAASNWDLAIGEIESELSAGSCEFLVANGNLGTISPSAGIVVRESGTDSALLDYDVTTSQALANTINTSFGTGALIEIFQLNVTTADSYDINLTGAAGLRWALFAPGSSSAWLTRSAAFQQGAGALSQSFNLTPGIWAFVLFSDVVLSSPSNYALVWDLTPNPLPILASIAPSTATSLGASFTLQVSGSNFINGSQVRWNGSALPTTFVSSSQLSASVSQTLLALGGTATVTVFSPLPGGGTSGPATFTINNPSPSLTSLSPSTATSLGAAFTMTVNGSNLRSNSVVRWNGSNLTTTFVSTTQLTAQVSASLISAAGTASVTVFTPTPGGGTSTSSTFTINNPLPALSAISPSSTTAGGAAFALALSGFNFRSTSVARWNGAPLATTFVSATQLTANVPASLIAVGGTASVTVNSPSPGGGTSASQTFTINNVVPAITGLLPNLIVAGSPATTININGSGFVAGTVARVNGANVSTTFVSATQVQAGITASQLAAPGILGITVFNPAPGGGVSPPQNLGVIGPALLSITPGSISVMTPTSAAVLITATGLNFLSTSVLHANGTPLATNFINATTLTANLGPSILQTQRPGGIAIHVANSPTAISNGKAIEVGSWDNAGLVSRRPLNPAPGQAYNAVLEDMPPNALFSLYVDGDNVPPLAPFIDPAMNNVLAVSNLAGSSMSLFIPLVESFGLFGPAIPVATTAQGGFTLPGFVLPNPALGVNLTVQGLYLDATAPYGFRLTWARFPDSL